MRNSTSVPCSDLAPNIESRADLLGALAHAWQTPVSIASRVQELRVDALSIIPDAQPKKAFAIRDVGFDLACLCVAERIHQRFARDAVDIVAEDGMQLPRRALYRNAEASAGRLRQIGNSRVLLLMRSVPGPVR